MRDSLKKYLLFCFLSTLQVTSTFGLGSLDTTLTGTDKSHYIDFHYTFDPGAYAKGFILFTKGFSIAPGSTVTLSVTDPVDGPVYLNGGTLILAGDMLVGKFLELYGPGTVVLSSLAMLIEGQLRIKPGGAIAFSGAGTIGGETIFIEPGGVLDFTPWTFGTIGAKNIFGVNSSSFLTSTLGVCSIGGVSFFITENSTFAFNWTIGVFNTVEFQGSNVIVERRGPTEINSNATLLIGPSVSYQSYPGHSLSFVDGSSLFQLDSAQYLHAGGGDSFTKGKFLVNGECSFSSASKSFFKFGDGVLSSNDLEVEVAAGATLKIDDGMTLSYKNIN